MAKGSDRKHFEDYRDQTRVKHDILAAYLPAYYHILKGWNKNLVFIDGFAGPGTYTQAETGKTFDGSPLLALKLIAADKDFTEQVSTVFIESDDILFKQLLKNVESFYKGHPEIRKPNCLPGTFSERVNEILQRLDGKLAPTFLFVDLCGVSGASFETIRAVMACEKCEAFIFFNIDGVRRIAGLDALSPVLVELMGSKERAQALYDEIRTTLKVAERERMILSHYRRALAEEISAEYTIPFGVEHEDQHKTSHYFIHATKHPLGFRIMKDVMWRLGHAEDQPGALELRQKSRTNFIPLFDLQGDEIKQNILNALRVGPLRVSVFYQEWTNRPNDLLCESAYRKVLLALEADGKIEVLGKDGKNVVGFEARRPYKGQPTLGKDYFVRLRK
jgi:three-Cys-motif partner protein